MGINGRESDAPNSMSKLGCQVPPRHAQIVVQHLSRRTTGLRGLRGFLEIIPVWLESLSVPGAMGGAVRALIATTKWLNEWFGPVSLRLSVL